jgi:sulfide dehydrogenase cytochrome subunit
MQNSLGIRLLMGATLASLSLALPAQAEELSQGGMLSASCAGCHGPAGRSPGAIPALSGKTAEFIRTALEEFRSGERASTVMGRHAKGYTDEEILLIAEYFEKQK